MATEDASCTCNVPMVMSNMQCGATSVFTSCLVLQKLTLGSSCLPPVSLCILSTTSHRLHSGGLCLGTGGNENLVLVRSDIRLRDILGAAIPHDDHGCRLFQNVWSSTAADQTQRRGSASACPRAAAAALLCLSTLLCSSICSSRQRKSHWRKSGHVKLPHQAA